MSELTLDIHQEGEVTLPGELANTTLSLSELGALFCFMVITGQEVDVDPRRMGSDELKTAIASLREREIVKAHVEDHQLKISIDFESVQLSQVG